MNKMYAIGGDLIEKGEDFVVARVVQTTGSTPRKKNAWLLMTRQGKFFGTVGGGKLEALVELICKETLETKISGVHNFSLTPEDQNGIDMRCGGDATVSIDYINHKEPSLFMGDFELDATAIIFGAGHVGKEVAKIAKYIGFSTIILDDRPEFANQERFPDVDRLIVLNNFQEAFTDLRVEYDSFIIIVTRGHSGDYDVLKQALSHKCAYIGMIGSRKKIGVVFQQLLEDGFTNADLDRVHSPIGIDISAETPEEIAISIAAELIHVRASI